MMASSAMMAYLTVAPFLMTVLLMTTAEFRSAPSSTVTLENRTVYQSLPSMSQPSEMMDSAISACSPTKWGGCASLLK